MGIIITIFKAYLRVVYFFLKMLKTDHKKILLLSRQYNKKTIDYSMIKRNLNKRYPSYSIVILAQKLNKKHLFNYFIHIHKQMYHLATSKVCIVDTYIIPVSVLKHKKSLTIIQLCHGVGNIKKFAYQTLKSKSGRDEHLAELMCMHKNYDYVISTSDATSKFYRDAFRVPESKMLNFGPPKIDYLLTIPQKRETVLESYPGLRDKPVVLYVSTFRTYPYDYLGEFVEKFPFDKFNLIINIHPVEYKYNPNVDEVFKNTSIYRCREFSTSELLSVCDFAITDYSSFVFESAILDIPTYLFVPDYDQYIAYNGINVDIFRELPGCVFKKAKELFDCMLNKQYNKEVIRIFKSKYIANCDGTSTDKLVDFVIKTAKEESEDY